MHRIRTLGNDLEEKVLENKLKKLFDYQHFENNSRLSELISETESRYAAELSDDELFMVSAAGEVENNDDKKEK